jgi:D-alanyl-D-alanine carboxypeptidase
VSFVVDDLRPSPHGQPGPIRHATLTRFLEEQTVRHALLQYRAVLIATLAVTFLPATAQVPSTLSPDLRQKIDQAVGEVLTRTGVPGASVAIVKNGQIAYLKAYGDARLEPQTPARPEMRYSIGSISKQFTATAILLLQEQGKLSLDDKVAKFIPDLTRAKEVTIRQLLSHTSGYQDYWPQDYVPPFMLQPITANRILDLWARKPLDFDPGNKWQYSNTNFVIAGVIVEKASGMPLLDFLHQNIFDPLGMKSVTNTDQEKLGASDPTGYMRYALGPLRPAPKEGKGWLFAAGELAMTASDLAKWDLSIIEQKVLKPSSYKEFETEVLLKNGVGTQYGLGVDVTSESGRRVLGHGGEVSGFTSQNTVFPDEHVAIVVLTNQDAVGAPGQIARDLAPLLFAANDPETTRTLDQARKIFASLQQDTIDRSLFTDNANSYFSESALKDFSSGLAPLGTPLEFTQTGQHPRGGMLLRIYRVKFPQKILQVWTYEMPDGKLEQYQVAAVE